MNRSCNMALLQMSCSDDRQDNLEQACRMMEQAAGQGAHIVCLPELFLSSYFCQYIREQHFDLSEPVPGPATERLCREAARLGVVVTASLFERAAAGLYYNTLAVIDADGSYLGKYRKMHIPDDPGFHEKYYFTPGDLGYRVFHTRYARIGTLICWDQWYPEAARITALKGADLLVYPTAIASLPEEQGELASRFIESWQLMQRSHAVANGCYVASINRCGVEDRLTFWGRSFICGTFGEMLAEAGEEPQVVMAACDGQQIESQRRTWPFFRDRRIDTYREIEQRYIPDGDDGGPGESGDGGSGGREVGTGASERREHEQGVAGRQDKGEDEADRRNKR